MLFDIDRIMKLKKLECVLSRLSGFRNPKIKFEQYATSSEMAVSIVDMIDSLVSLEGSFVADLGCGSGMLMTTIAAAYNPSFVLGIDIDRDALSICKENLATAEVEERCSLLNSDVIGITDILQDKFDVIVTNPPFGTKNNSGLDIAFVQAGLSILNKGGSLFSLHKSSTRNYILKKSEWRDMGVEVECIAQMRWGLPATYNFHKRKSVDIDVDLIHYKKT